MPRLFGVCPACQDNKHNVCANEGACACALRQHPNIPDRNNQQPSFRPNPTAPQRR